MCFERKKRKPGILTEPYCRWRQHHSENGRKQVSVHNKAGKTKLSPLPHTITCTHTKFNVLSQFVPNMSNRHPRTWSPTLSSFNIHWSNINWSNIHWSNINSNSIINFLLVRNLLFNRTLKGFRDGQTFSRTYYIPFLFQSNQNYHTAVSPTANILHKAVRHM